MRKLTLILATVLGLFAWYSLPREKLVPFSSGHERTAYLLTGDEPAYLLTAQAIRSGDGQNVRNVNSEKTFKRFQSRGIIGGNYGTWAWYRTSSADIPFWFDRGRNWGDSQIFPRPPLVSVVVSPVSMLENRIRWSSCLILASIAVIGAGVALAFQPEKAGAVSAFAVFAFLGSLPAAYYTCQIYPETVAGVLLMLSLVLNARPGRKLHWLGYFLMIVSLWGTARVLAGVTGAAAVYAVRAVKKKHFADLIPLALGFALYFGHNLWLWGYPSLPNTNPWYSPSLGMMPRGVVINFFSNSFGLFLLSPVTFVGIICFVLLFVFGKKDYSLYASAALFLGILLMVASFGDYRAGTCPAGRYQVVQSYVLLFPVLRFLRESSPAPGLRAEVWKGRILAALFFLGVISIIHAFFVLRWPGCWFERYLPVFKYPLIIRHYRLLPDPEEVVFSWKLAGWLVMFFSSLFLRDVIDWLINPYREYIKRLKEERTKTQCGGG